jgi:hypothetical protein
MLPHAHALVALLCLALPAAEPEAGPTVGLVEVLPLTERVLLLHADEGHVVHHRRGQPRSEETVVVTPLDVAAAARADSYTIASPDDPAYREGVRPARVARKSKGTDFAWFADSWQDGRAVNRRPDHAKEHWLYLTLPAALRPGGTYTVATGGLFPNGASWTFRFDPATVRSEAVHVNTLGYVPDAPQKFGYVSAWTGDGGGLDVAPFVGRRFRLIDQADGRVAFEGKVAFRARGDQAETANAADSPPRGNYLNADVAECDFSGFAGRGRYVLAVDGVGGSFPFEVGAAVYRPAYYHVARALYHNRSGIALGHPFTEFPRPAPHNPKLTPGFAGKLLYTTVRWTEWGSEGGDPKALLAAAKGPIESAGWYQDAGDWDSYPSHLRVPRELLLAVDLAPENVGDRELDLPESGNGLPDLLDEAAWLPRFGHRLRAELLAKGYGTGGIGLRIAGDAFGPDEKTLPDGRKVGQGSWEDVDRTWVASGEDPWSTFGHAAAAAHLAFLLERGGWPDPEGVDWAAEARAADRWAREHTRPGDEAKGGSLRDARAWSAAALFRLTGEAEYARRFLADVADVGPGTVLDDDRAIGVILYLLPGGAGRPDPDARERLRAALYATADALVVDTPARRALRWGGNWYMPMLVGQQTTPMVLTAAAAERVAREDDPARARRYRAGLYTTCDYFLGGNALNTTWITGVGPRHPRQVFHMDAWYNGTGGFHPGLIPYGPWRKERDLGQGPWDVAWPHATVHPPIDAWPGNERWFDNRCSPMNSEFTVHQNLGPTAALFAVLAGPARP